MSALSLVYQDAPVSVDKAKIFFSSLAFGENKV